MFMDVKVGGGIDKYKMRESGNGENRGGVRFAFKGEGKGK